MKPRICVYISEEAAARLLTEARRRGVSKSFLVRAALDQLLGGPDCEAIDHSAMMRRLNWMSRQLEHLDRDMRVVNETVALHARYHLTVTPPLSPPIRQAACKLGAARFDEFAAQVGRRVHLGTPLMRETMERVSEASPHLFTGQQSCAEPDSHAVHDGTDDNVVAMTAFQQQTGIQNSVSNTDRETAPHDVAIVRRSFVLACRVRVSQSIEALAQNWRLIACVFLPFAAGFYLSYLFRNINAVIAGPLTAELGLDAGQFGLLTSVYFLTFAAAQLPVGILLDRYGPRRVQSGLFVVAAGGAALFALSESFLPLVLSRALIGLGVAAALAAGLKAIVLWFPKERLPLANGWMVMLGALGAVTATTPVEALVASTGWRELFLFLAVVTAACALIVYLVVPDAPATEQVVSKETALGLRAVFTDHRFWRLAPLSATSIGTAWALQGLWAAAWLTDVERFGRVSLVRHLLVMAVALCLGALAIGWAADRLRSRGISLRAFLGSLAALFIAAELALIFRCFSSSFVLWAMIAAFGSGTVLSFAILAEYFPKELTGRANAALNVFHMGGAFALQCLTGFVIQAWAKDHGHYPEVAYQVAFAINVLLQIIALVWFSLPRLRSLVSTLMTRRYPFNGTTESVMRFGMKKRATLNPASHPQTPFMRCLTCGSIRPLEDRLMPMVARPAI